MKHIEDIQLDFYYYAAMTEAKKYCILRINSNFQIESKTTRSLKLIRFLNHRNFTTFNFLIKKFDITTINDTKAWSTSTIKCNIGCLNQEKKFLKMLN
jgi:hypothetical protein